MGRKNVTGFFLIIYVPNRMGLLFDIKPINQCTFSCLVFHEKLLFIGDIMKKYISNNRRNKNRLAMSELFVDTMGNEVYFKICN